nr:cobalamin-dependent protein [Methylomarinum sp. Ch1-1]MDP4519231.1 cobalamin-dependent protein [Methylomarinum sp. Ch1-1]
MSARQYRRLRGVVVGTHRTGDRRRDALTRRGSRGNRAHFVHYPPYFNVDDYRADNRSSVLPPFTIPYGILSLHAYLADRCSVSPEIDILDLNLPLRQAVTEGDTDRILSRFDELVAERVRTFRPTLAGISALFNVSFRYLQDIARVIQAQLPSTLIVAGGGLPSAAFREVLELCPDIDAICKGEGEIPLRDLVDAGDKSVLLNEHPSWITREGVAAGKIPSHTFVQDLDDIPMLDYGTVDLDDYNARSIDKRYSDEKTGDGGPYFARLPVSVRVLLQPGLAWPASAGDERGASRGRGTADERALGTDGIAHRGRSFFFDKSRAKAVLRVLAQLQVRIEFPNGVAVYAIDEEIAELFSRAGVSTVALAVESGSDYVLNKIIKKPLKIGLVKDKVEMLRRHGVQSHVFIVLGLPGEMPEHRRQTLDLLLDVGFDWAHIFCAIPIFGSRLHEICVEQGYIRESNFLDHVNTKSVIRAPGVDPEQIEDTAYQMNLSVNFVHNYNLASGNYETAIKYFRNVAAKYPEHAFAHQALARAYGGVGEQDLAARATRRFEHIVASDPWWHEQAVRHGLLADYEAGRGVSNAL